MVHLFGRRRKEIKDLPIEESYNKKFYKIRETKNKIIVRLKKMK